MPRKILFTSVAHADRFYILANWRCSSMKRKKKGRKTKRFFKATSFWISIILSLAVLVIYILLSPEFNPEGKSRLLGL